MVFVFCARIKQSLNAENKKQKQGRSPQFCLVCTSSTPPGSTSLRSKRVNPPHKKQKQGRSPQFCLVCTSSTPPGSTSLRSKRVNPFQKTKTRTKSAVLFGLYFKHTSRINELTQ